MEIPSHCKKPMLADFTIGARTSWECQNRCGHRAWTGPESELKRYLSPLSRLRSCQKCGGALPSTAHPKTLYHKRCAQIVKKEQARAYNRREALARV